VKKLMQTAAAVLPLALGAAAQDKPMDLDVLKKHMAETEQQMVKLNMVGSVKGPVVKGMPYSADEITEVNQVLSDGTRIHRETKTSVYRDSEGRTRRETPENITINDPVANVTYMINPKTNSVRKLQMASSYMYRREGAFGTAIGGGPDDRTTFSLRTNGDGPTDIIINGKALEPQQVQEMIAKAKAEGKAEMKTEIRTEADVSTSGPMLGAVTMSAAAPKKFTGRTESLGKQNMEGVTADGTRSTQTIEIGTIGNDRPIQIVNESWYSEELGMTVMSKRTDPRTGDETFRVTNIRRGDPAPYLFQPPAGSTINETKM
jgi:hypothetical protein